LAKPQLQEESQSVEIKEFSIYQSICGAQDEHIPILEEGLGIQIIPRGNTFILFGSLFGVQKGREFLHHVVDTLQRQGRDRDFGPGHLQELLLSFWQKPPVTPERGGEPHSSPSGEGAFKERGPNRQRAASKPGNKKGYSAEGKTHLSTAGGRGEAAEGADATSIFLYHPAIGKPMRRIAPRSVNQRRYMESLGRHTITIGVGPAGTGKTFLAVAYALYSLWTEQVDRIILTRPAVEAGENLGFLPGDLAQKVDPYLRPLYDSLYELAGIDYIQRLQSEGVIEVAPLAFMRGRTLSRAFIILDEAQNTSEAQMKMFLTRFGEQSTVAVSGDITQVDLQRNNTSGLLRAVDILKDIDDIGIIHLDNEDISRHPLIERILYAYDQKKEG
jgi:phosphate starvation-inducible protein PhoH